ncbi:MAG: hypothetical protein KIS92_23490 [Planctomycetota bacterium]|nr:hypothetical protein [Planctomycetota bacterium]
MRVCLAACLLLLSVFSLRAADEPAPMPDDALAMIAIREQGASFDRLVDWCGKIVANSGALAKQTLTSALFPIPAQDGVDPKAPAVVFWLDTQPNLLNGPGDQAIVLGVSDAKVLREAVRAVFGGEEEDGVLHATLAQGFDKPERTLAIRVDEKWAWVAPDNAALKKLMDAAGGRGARAFLPAGAPDASMRVNLDLLRRRHKPEFEKLLALGETLGGKAAPEAAEDVARARKGIADRAGELAALDLSLSCSAEALEFGAQVKALPGSELFNAWSRPAGGEGATLALALPAETPLSAAFAPHAAVQPRAGLPGEGPPAAPAAPDWIAPLLKLQRMADRGAGVRVAATEASATQILIALGASEPAQAEAALKDALDAIVKFSGECARPMMKLKEGDPVPFELTTLPEAELAGAKVKGWSLGMAKDYRLIPGLEKIYLRSIGWPFEIRCAVTDQGLLVAAGKETEAALKAALENAAKAKAGEATKFAEGETVAFELRPVGVLRVLLNAVLDPDVIEAAQFTDRLEDVPVSVKAGASGGAGRMQLRLPAKAVKAAMDAYLRLDRANIDPFKIRIPDAANPVETVPAPPAP